MKAPDKRKRRQDRTKAVLPVRIFGKDASGNAFEELAHTLDIAPQGGRLGAIHREMKPLDQLTIQYRQHRMEFRVVWTKLLDKTREYQVGLQAMEEKAGWGLRAEEKLSEAELRPAQGAMAAHGSA
jgi:hypothetical protein